MVRVVGELGLPQPDFAQVLFPIDVRDLAPAVLTELLIDQGVHPGNLRVGFLGMDYCGVIIEQFTEGKGFYAMVEQDCPALGRQLIEVLQRVADGVPFADQIQILAAAAPLASVPRK